LSITPFAFIVRGDAVDISDHSVALASVAGLPETLPVERWSLLTGAVNGLFEALCPDTPPADLFRKLVPAGGVVLVKPNWVLHQHHDGKDLCSVVTHPALLWAVADAVVEACPGLGTLLVADAPQADADFGVLRDFYRLDALGEHIRKKGAQLEYYDLRQLIVSQADGLVVERTLVPPDRNPVRIVRVAASFLDGLGRGLSAIYGADYDRRQTRQHHREGFHEYAVSQRVLDADLVLSLPKLKTHKKSGVTLSLKNTIGINCNKNYIPHYCVGFSPRGDEFPPCRSLRTKAAARLTRACIDLLARSPSLSRPVSRLAGSLTRGRSPADCRGEEDTSPGANAKSISRFYERIVGVAFRGGNWAGNDTVWRSILDLNNILFFADRNGRLGEGQQRAYISLIDGLVAGEGLGPMAPTPRHDNVLLAGFNPVAVDLVATQLMGFDPAKIALMRAAATGFPSLFNEVENPIEVRSNVPEWSGDGIAYADSLKFRPCPGWENIVGREPSPREADA